jgi:photosystem II stability/assembly factor-like uncharacterized protein
MGQVAWLGRVGRAGVVVIGCALVLVATAHSIDLAAIQPFEASAATRGMRYRPLDFSRGGRVTAVTGVPAQPLVYYFGSTGGGVWKTTDAGVTWRNVSDGSFEAGSIGAITVADSDANVIYVGTGSACPRNNVSAGVGMYRSRDGGRTWTHAGLRDAGQIGRIRVDPADPNLVYVAVLGNVFAPNDQRGVFRSKNGGGTWERVLFLNDRTGAIDLAIDPKFPRVLYAALWAFDRKPWGVTSTSRDAGIYKSDDGGDTWRQLRKGLPSDVALDRSAVAVSPSKPGRVWALLDTERYDGGLYRSDNGGESWVLVNNDRDLIQRAFYYVHLFADPANEDTLYVMNVQFMKSVDGGKTFQRVPAPHTDHHDLWVNPLDSQRMINGNDGGANVSLTGGTSWSSLQNQPTAEIYRVSVDEQFPYRLYAAQQDDGTVSISSAARPEMPWYAVGGTEAAHIAVDPHEPTSVWATAYWGEVTRIDTRTREVEATHPYPEWLTGTRNAEVKFRYNWNAPLRVSRHVKGTVWVASQYLHRTRDRGRSWQVISPDLTGTGDAVQNQVDDLIRGSSAFEPWGTIFAFEESPTTPGLLWSGSDDGLVYLSRDDSNSWVNVTPANMPDRGTVNMIDPSVHSPGRAHIAVYKYMQNDFSPYIFQTDDFGKTWRRLTDGTNGIPANHPVRVVREDPEQKGLLFAGTEFGLYFSTDNGARWQPLQLNLPVTPVTDLAVHRKDLVVVTQGRGFWILDDITPLEVLATGNDDRISRVLPPRAVYRGVSDSATVWYTRDRTIAGPVTVEIRDRSGRLVTRSPGQPADVQAPRGAAPGNEGLNRFDWNLRYDPPFQVPSGVGLFAALGPGFAGPQEPPGTYEVTVSSASWKATQPLIVRSKPATTATEADYDDQLALALRIGARTRTLYELLATTRDLQKQVGAIEQIPAVASDRQIRSQLQSLVEQLAAIENGLAQTRATGSQDTAPSRLDSQFIGLYGRVIAHDGRPTEPEQARFRDVDPLLTKLQGALDAVIHTTLPAVNKLLASRRVPAIVAR